MNKVANNIYLLERLSHMIQRRELYWDGSNLTGRQLIRRSIWAAFTDCCQAGLRVPALHILARRPSDADSEGPAPTPT